MADWNSTLYQKFKKERTQPAIVLANRIRTYHPKKIADIGCDPGNSTEVLKSVFPISEYEMDKNVITRIETNKRYVTDIELRALSEVLGVSYAFLIDGEDR